MVAVLLNSIFIIGGTLIGCVLKKYLKENLLVTTLAGLGLCIVYLGIKGSLDIENVLYVIIAISLGGIIGEAIDIDNFFIKLMKKFDAKHDNSGFIEASIIFCSGSMSVIGSIQAGIYHDYTILISKGVIDFFTSIVLTLKYGYSVGLSATSVFIYQGLICLFSTFLVPLTTNTSLMNGLSGTGSLILLAVGLNMLKITKIKTMNLLPAMVIIVILNLIF